MTDVKIQWDPVLCFFSFLFISFIYLFLQWYLIGSSVLHEGVHKTDFLSSDGKNAQGFHVVLTWLCLHHPSCWSSTQSAPGFMLAALEEHEKFQCVV